MLLERGYKQGLTIFRGEVFETIQRLLLLKRSRLFVVYGKVTNELVEYVEIKPGEQSDIMTEVFGNLGVGDKIVTILRSDLKSRTKIAMN